MPKNAKNSYSGTITSIIIYMRKTFSGKTDNALKCFLKRFFDEYLLSYRKPTHQGPALPENYRNSITTFQLQFREEILNSHISPHRVFNMDETPLYFGEKFTKVIANKDVLIDTPKNSDTRMTLILAISYAGDKLPPLKMANI